MLSLFALIGCGGGGGGSVSGNFGVFISDDLSTGYDQVWVTVHEIEMQDSSGSFKSVFSSPTGEPVDLASLSDGAPKFLFMGNASLTAGTYTAMRVTMSRNLTLVPTGGTSGDACTFDSSLDFGTDKTRATFNLGGGVAFSGEDNVVVDFDLPNWTRAGNVVTPAFKQGNGSTLNDMGRHESDDYHGTIARLAGTAPNQTFVLTRTSGSFLVSTSASTIVYREDASGRPALANGQRVEVRGKFDVNTKTLVASVIKIEDEEDDEDEVKGPTSELDSNALTVVVTIRESEGFIPSGKTVTVQFSSTTRFFTKAGAPISLNQMLDHLSTGVEIEAEGTYSSGPNVLTAYKMKLHPEDGEHEAEAEGPTSNVNQGAGTFSLTVQSWYGFSSSAGSVIQVQTDGTTTYRNDNGSSISANDFYAAIQAGSWAEVEGTFSAGVFVARKAKLEDETGAGQPEAEGYVTTSSELAGTVTINLIEWFGFNGSPGASQVIQTTGTTEFLDDDGNVLTKSQFFAGLTAGTVIDAKGSYSAGVLTATRARYKD